VADVDHELAVKSDARLLQEARTDAGAFREVYDRYAAGVYGFHLRRTRDPDAAHDLAAETFAQAWLARTRFRDEAGGSAGPWLYAIARYLLLASVRRQKLERSACERLTVFDRLEHEPSEVEPVAAWLDGLDEALDDLPQSQREAIELRVFSDLDYAGVADALGTTPQAARVRVSRGLSALRRQLTRPKPMEASK
jgi:RNA polymerase sigma factor (sigma-70 family)